MARVEAKDIKFIEAHGTGTNLGDPIEVDALSLAFNLDGQKSCALGSIKSNIGHLGEGAGIAGLIKAALTLKNGLLPASLNFETPNVKINFEDSPFYVNTKTVKLERNGIPLLGGVSSFGIGGTNAHIVLEEFIDEREESPDTEYDILPVSATDKWSLKQNIQNLKAFLKGNSNLRINRLAQTLKQGRKDLPVREFIASKSSITDIIVNIEKLMGKPEKEAKRLEKTAFLFPGQGNQYLNMARGMYENIQYLKQEMDICFKIADRYTDYDSPLKSLLFHENETDNAFNINNTELAQVVLFIVEYAVAKHLMHIGVNPDVLVGHSIGEYVAACLAGVFELQDAIKIVCARGSLMQKAPIGKMLSVGLSETELIQKLPDNLSLAAINSEDTCVVSGIEEDILFFQKQMEKENIPTKFLVTSHAFHSYLMDNVLEDFKEFFRGINLQKPSKQFLSNVTGKVADADYVSSPAYWSDQLRNTVRFKDCLSNIPKGILLIEVGPGRSLSTFALQSQMPYAINTISHSQEIADDTVYYYNAIGNIWKHGIDINWENQSEGPVETI